MLKLENGRPKDLAGRPDKEIRTYDLLDTLGIEYKRIDHEEAMTMEVCEEIDEALQATICKNLFLSNRQETDFYLLMMPGIKSLRLRIYRRHWEYPACHLRRKSICRNFLT